MTTCDTPSYTSFQRDRSVMMFLSRTTVVVFFLALGIGSAGAEPPAGQQSTGTVVQRAVAHAASHPAGRAPHSFDASRFAGDLDHLPIGVFDSGIGGLTVLEAILSLDAFDNDSLRPGADGRRDFENERFIYLGDQANMPYGNYAAAGKENFLRELILKDVTFLLGRRYYAAATAPEPSFDKPPVKAIVIACNTATAYGLDDIRQAVEAWRIPVFVVGVVEAGADGVVRHLKETSETSTVAVLATVGTCSSMAYPQAISHAMGLAGRRVPPVVQQGSVGLAGAIEGDPELIARSAAKSRQAAVQEYIESDVIALLENYRRSGNRQPISTVVLGCTHFPLVQDKIAAAFATLRQREQEGARPYASLVAEELRFIDPAELTAKTLFRELAKARLRARATTSSEADGDLFYISVPNPAWPGVRLDDAGQLDHQYKYGRAVGQMQREDTRYVPMTAEVLPETSLNLIRTSLPEVWKRLAP